MVNTSIRAVSERINKERLNWTKFLRNTLATDLSHYKEITQMTRSEFILELVTFVETTLSDREKARERKLKNG